ncbi:hypothetical protein [Dietzia sp. B32]|uniref:hypothetical protein n=1 Tax=Dietzia sp. B32 TaxID=2915130 RepID=UPI0021ADABE6|nr:hypothetical protein [Dietzia sp. B32]UVE94983.1 hypothetical protein L8M95_16020 [Dietzia sp. B32]
MDTSRGHAPISVPVAAQRRLAVALAVLLAAVALVVAGAPPAQAAARLSASSSIGGAVASSSGPTTFTVSGSGYQAVQGGFGGIYVGFGWVNGSNWGPSKGGATGNSYDYIPDDQSRNNKGYQAFVAFPGSETSGEAQGTMGADGSFRVQLTVPGPTFTGAGGKRIDCLKMTCGFFTWGAHGVRNGANETFTPVTFQAGTAPASPAAAEAPPAQAPAAPAAAGRAGSGRAAEVAGRAGRAQTAVQAQGAPAAGAGGTEATAAAPSSGDPGAAVESATSADGAAGETGGTTLSSAAVIEVDRRSARAGGAMGFAAAGFWPGEQVYVVLGDGLAAVGPVVAGVDGEVAGVIVLPEDIEAGTHEIRAAGAGSGLEATERFPLRVDITPAASSNTLRDSMKWLFLALAGLALLAAAAFMVRRSQDAGVAEAYEAPAAQGVDEPGAGGDNYLCPPEDGAHAQTAYPTTATQEEVQR